MEINKIYHGNCLNVLQTLPENLVDSIVTDPPYELGFMGKKWDNTGIAYNVQMWKECLRVLKPGGHLLSFGGTRTYYRMAVAIEDAGFEIRDMIEWVYSTGFPKSLNIGKAVDKLRRLTKGSSEWEGWGTALKPAHEPICMARKPLSEKTVAKNVLKWGTGGINIDESRVEYQGKQDFENTLKSNTGNIAGGTFKCSSKSMAKDEVITSSGRFPANLIHDNSEEVREYFPNSGKGNGGRPYNYAGRKYNNKETSMFNGDAPQSNSNYNDFGSASRFFKSIIYQPKASKKDRGEGNNHPTVKPIALMEYLIKMVTPNGGIVLDPFAGSGSTLVAAKKNGYGYIGIELDSDYTKIAENRINNVQELLF